ncbi:MAG TPA: DoxX family protein [Burkholderiales bacterium]|nr:DoxX family protein [Burkholderiales bacterium]
MNGTSAALPLVGRILMAALFIIAGAGKLMGFAGTAGYLGKLGFPMPEVMTVITILIELGGGILLLLGWQTRWVAWLLAIFVVIATLAAHRFWEFDAAQAMNQRNHFLKNFAIVGGLLFLAAFGPGRAAVDRR